MAKLDSKRIHDLRSIYADFKIILGLIKSGYHFDDADGPALIQQMEKTLGMLHEELEKIIKQE